MTSVLFLISLLVSQINFNLFTGMSVGVCATTVVEGSTLFSKIYLKMLEKYPEEKAFVNTLFVIGVSTLLFGLLSFAMLVFKIDYYVQFIPLELTNGILAGAGLSTIFIGRCLFYNESVFLFNLYFIMILCTVLLIFWIERFFPKFKFTALLLSLFFIILFHVIKPFFPIKLWKELGFISDKLNLQNSLEKFYYLKVSDVNVSVIIEMLPNILNLTFYSLLFLPFYLTVFIKTTKLKESVQREIKTQGMSNLIGSFFCLPTYFVCSYSIALYESGFSSFYNSLFITFSYLLIFFVGDFVWMNVPIVILAIFPIMMGVSLCIPALYLPRNFRNIYELIFTWFIAFLIGFNYSIHFVFILGMLVSLVSYHITIYLVRNPNDHSENELHLNSIKNFTNVDYLVVDYPLFFVNVNKFTHNISKLSNANVIIDLYRCVAFDMSGNDVFHTHISEDKIYYIIGKPYSFRIQELKQRFKNIFIFNNHCEALDKINSIG
ncbi:hypothetical protein H312_02835 [Anncaliia algerae PRA339]|uniref:SLC26A/SulP transporter domain-containing protein n=1 Tax=Anncaliia algerae PRA339 TaxID=1288291 RepID=A0A059EY02_9MICR|nr:hypothetical protein H312_02835 [Anncaliia algerae PRA339]